MVGVGVEGELRGDVRDEALATALRAARGEEGEVARADHGGAVRAVVRDQTHEVAAAPAHLLDQPVEEIFAAAAGGVEALGEEVRHLPELVEEHLAVAVDLAHAPARRVARTRIARTRSNRASTREASRRNARRARALREAPAGNAGRPGDAPRAPRRVPGPIRRSRADGGIRAGEHRGRGSVNTKWQRARVSRRATSGAPGHHHLFVGAAMT